MSTSKEPNPENPGASLAGKYLAFVLGTGTYGVAVTKVREIIRPSVITAVPQMPPFVKGVINLRGKIIPMMDLKLKLKLPESAPTERTCMVILNVKISSESPTVTGLIVDGADEVLNITAAEIQPTPDFGAALDTAYITGMVRIKEKLITLLNMDRVLKSDALIPFGDRPQA